MNNVDSTILFLFIINPISGTAQKHNLPELIHRILKINPNRIQIVFTQYAGHARELAAEAVSNGIPNVVSVGGDGTMNEIASALLYTKTCLGMIPMGSGNGLARHLKIPLNITKAIDLLNAYKSTSIDSGNINGVPFFCTAGIGIDAQVSKAFDELPSRGFKTYAKALFNKVRSYRGDDLIVRMNDDTEISGTFLLSTFANANQYGNNAYIAPSASLSDGQLNLILMKPVNFIQAIGKTYKLFSRTLERDSSMHHVLFKKIELTRKHEGPAHVDGEPILLGTTITVRCEPQSLRILVPE
jgi:diacylglycerol kinase (ATP)